MKAIFFLFIIFFYSTCNSQLKIDIKVDSISKQVTISLYNDSPQSIVVPLDKSSLRPYFENICLDISEYEYPYPILGLNTVIREIESGKTLESYASSSMPNNDYNFKKYIENNIKEKNIFIRNVHKWQKKNQIKNYTWAKFNLYLNKNLIILKPKQEVNFVSHFDLNNITNNLYKYNFYNLEKGKRYVFSVTLNANECIYSYLTQGQKQKLKNYKLFTGHIESNKIELKR